MISKPRKPIALTGTKVEVLKGIRITRVGETLEILDLHSGRFETVKVDLSKHPGRITSGKAGWLLSIPWLSEALPEGLLGLTGGDFASVDDLKASLASAPERLSPTFPIPSASMIRWFCFPAPWEKPNSDEIERILAVVLSLAWRDGKAFEMELEGDLARRLGTRTAPWKAMDEALKRSDGNIRKEGAGNFAVWRMSEEWKRDDPNERVVRKGRRQEEPLEDLFGDDA